MYIVSFRSVLAPLFLANTYVPHYHVKVLLQMKATGTMSLEITQLFFQMHIASTYLFNN